MAIVSTAPHRHRRPIERWRKATDEVDFGERDRLLARARELGPRHHDAGEIFAAYAKEQARVAAELAQWRAESRARTAAPPQHAEQPATRRVADEENAFIS